MAIRRLPRRAARRVLAALTAGGLLAVASGASAAMASFSGPHMTLSKSAGPTSGPAPLSATYTYALVNDGADTLYHVTVSDDSCWPVSYQSGDANGDQLLQPGETWIFTCAHTYSGNGSFTNHASAVGSDTQSGLPVSSNTASATVNAGVASYSGPHLTLSKSANPTSGDYPVSVSYSYTVLNDGMDTLYHLAVSDDSCSPVTYQSGDNNDDQLIEPGEAWVFSCSNTLINAGPNVNTATASASDTQTGLVVSSNSAQATVTVYRVPTTLSLSCPTSVSYGQQFAIRADVLAVGGGRSPTVGQVNFSGGFLGPGVGRPVGNGLGQNNVAIYPQQNLVPAGTYTITAVYNSFSPFYRNSSATCSITVVKADASVSLTASPNPSSAGQPVTLVATVTGNAPGVGNSFLTGTVTFQDATDGKILGTSPVVPGFPKTATLTTAFPDAGTHQIVALYNGDQNFNQATSLPWSQMVTGATGAHMTLSKSPAPTSGPAPLTVVYTYTLVNDGGHTLYHATVSDDTCSPVSYQSGDVNGDQLLQPGETWTFTCTQTYSTPGSFTNHATAAANDTQSGLAVASNTAMANVTVGTAISGGPHMTLSKSPAPTSGPAPLTVVYTYTLVNDGGHTLYHATVSDDTCSPVSYQSGDVNGDQLLQPGETWTFTCTQTYSTPGSFTNHATAAANDTQSGLAVASNTPVATVTVGPSGPG